MTTDNKELIEDLREFSAGLDQYRARKVRQAADALEAAERDAVRYQWIRNKRVNPHAYLPTGEQLDNYMDARLPAPPKKEE